MSRQLISRSRDLTQLLEEGYDIEVRSGHLLVKSVPYVDTQKCVWRGTLVSPLGDISGDVTRPPSDHTVYFTGQYPCRSDGRPIEQIRLSSGRQELGRGIVVDHRFSARPKEGSYRDYHHKMVTYIAHVSGPARGIDGSATAQVSAVVSPADEDCVFNYLDTASPRAGIAGVVAKMEGQKVAIVGGGGTAAYVLDFVAKTPVAEIHQFDGDIFGNHNAFRAPGAASLEELKARPLKVDYLRGIYSKMHRRIFSHPVFVTEENVDVLRGMTFVFLCLDRGRDKRVIVERLEAWGIPFVDVGMGVELTDGTLRGSVRVTASTPAKRDHLRKRVSFGDGDGPNDYARNVQIAELNAMNAALAVIKWKKLFGFYQDLEQEHCSVYTINGNSLANEDQQ